jgi:Xaa-Pro aminopeptidase
LPEPSGVSGRQERALEIGRGLGADGVLAAEPATVTWVTGFEGDVEAGPSPFALPPLAVVTREGPPILVVSSDDASAAPPGCEVYPYPGSTAQQVDPVGGAARALVAAAGGRKLASEPGALPAALAQEVRWVDAGAVLARERARKDPDEIDRLRAAVALCDVGQSEARARAEAGMSELELWALVRAAVEGAAGRRTPLLADLCSGARTGQGGGSPGRRALSEGDLVLCDLVPRRGGYWGDSCAALAVGEPRTSAVRKHRLACEALQRGIEAIRPGVRAGELDELVRGSLVYLHHSGHALGTTWHEEPRIVPGGATRLQAGMVLALEPAVYEGDEGVRVEQVVLVTEAGCAILSGHCLEL